MKKFYEYVEIQTTVDELLELNKPLLLKKAQAEIAENQKKEHERVTALLQRFPLKLRVSKVTIASLLEEYIAQRQNYVKNKISATIISFTDLFASKKTDPGEKMNINSLQESQSSANPHTVFSNLPADQYSLELYNKINAHIDAMTDYDSTVKGMYRLASLLTEENKRKSEQLMKTLKAILQNLISLTQYHTVVFSESKLYSYLKSKELIQHKSKFPIITRYYHNVAYESDTYESDEDGYKTDYYPKIQLHGCQGKEWQTISYTLNQDSLDPVPYHEIFLVSGAHLPDGGRFGDFIEKNLEEINLRLAVYNVTEELKTKIDTFIAHYPILYLYDVLDKNPTLKSFHDSLQELHRFDLFVNHNSFDPFGIRKNIYDKALVMAQKLGPDYVALLDDTNLLPPRPSNAVYGIMHEPNNDFFDKVLHTFTGNQFLSLLCDQLKDEFSPVNNHKNSSSSAPHF